jgi:hypothetical protein
VDLVNGNQTPDSDFTTAVSGIIKIVTRKFDFHVRKEIMEGIPGNGIVVFQLDYVHCLSPHFDILPSECLYYSKGYGKCQLVLFRCITPKNNNKIPVLPPDFKDIFNPIIFYNGKTFLR